MSGIIGSNTGRSSGLIKSASVASGATLLTATTLGSDASEMIFDDIFSSTYKIYKIFCYDLSFSANATVYIQYRVGGSNQSAANYGIRHDYAYGTSSTGTQVNDSTSGYTCFNGWTSVAETADYPHSIDFTFYNPNDNTFYGAMNGTSTNWSPTTYNEVVSNMVGYYVAKIAATGFRLFPSTGNILDGSRVNVYGMAE